MADLEAVMLPAAKVDRTVLAAERAIDKATKRVVRLRDVEPHLASRFVGLLLRIGLEGLVDHQSHLVSVVARHLDRAFEIVHLDLPRGPCIIEDKGLLDGLLFLDLVAEHRQGKRQHADSGQHGQ